MTKQLGYLVLALAFLFYPLIGLAQTEEEEVVEEEEEVVEEEEEEAAEAEEEEEVEEVVEEEEEEVEEEAEEEAVEEEDIESIVPPKPAPQTEFPAPGIALVKGDWVSLNFGAVFAQYFRFTYSGIGGDATDWHEEFVTKRIRTILTGSFWNERVTFHLEGDLVEEAFFNGDEQDSGFLLDARVNIFPLKGVGPEVLGGLGIAFGRFIPDFTYYMPRNVGQLDFVEYPLVTSTFAPWRQVGAELMFNHKYFDAAVGVFNGLKFVYAEDAAGNLYSTEWVADGYLGATWGQGSNLSDDNRAKDYLVMVRGKYPNLGIWVQGFAYIGMPEFYDLPTLNHSFGYAVTAGGEAGIDHRFSSMIKLKVIGGFSARRVEFPKDATCDVASGALCEAYTQTGFFGHVGVQIGRWVEPMVRVDWLNDRGQFLTLAEVPGLAAGENVWTIWPSVGLKFLLYGEHLQVTLVNTYKHFANPHYDDANDLTLQVILML